MNIGQKIRELRVAKLMTQAELAGSQITRNMLSCIENGSAMPSLSTVLYIAGRLNVPAGFLLAEEGDEAIYRKMNSFSNIKRAYMAGDLRGCRNLCVSACPKADDEISLLLANCDIGIAEEEFLEGRLRSACRFFDEALSYAEKTMYSTAHIKSVAKVYFRYMERISPTLYSDYLDEDGASDLVWNSPFAAYVDALEALDQGDLQVAERYLAAQEGNSFFSHHVRIRCMMERREYSDAKEALLHLLHAAPPLREVELYTALCELEIACRETEDFKGAYRYANEKLQSLEQLLKEF
jgi:transcriptional regulator with XRE-family HTH domain